MRELLSPHWIVGAVLSLGGATAYRYGSRLLQGRSLVAVELLGLVGIAVGLFVVARGTSRAAQKRLEAISAVAPEPTKRTGLDA